MITRLSNIVEEAIKAPCSRSCQVGYMQMKYYITSLRYYLHLQTCIDVYSPVFMVLRGEYGNQ
jgi:hypothetical protein